ncbi:large conductance mechanosensitive channel [Arcanobacterium pluranimalium]|uniref:large conductance mechanosensitive channel protein MscL n=1 Tax=Arcanobacterium pluranimalium TaxID=108028 RepID=UPI00195AA859|nr:large conductance mechanosensitive channel protein MscL [Arcanobacterium pluranimalium]MBM7824658.1 large conductance mechanosensitive channel [Arcanobacterium pluranimalium]
MLKGFKEFISRGNVVDLAVGVIIGGAFSPIVVALTDKVLMPLIAAIFGKPNFDQVGAFTLNGAQIMPGTVITALINFLIVAAAIYFFVVTPMNKLNRKRDEEPAAVEDVPADDVALLTEIRDLLAQNANRPNTNL